MEARAMRDLLSEILATKRREIESLRRGGALDRLSDTDAPTRDFVGALRRDGLSVVAEIKRRSPSRGWLHRELDPAALARSYQDHGAAALSVLTDHDHFGGSVDDLRRARQSVELPVLRKDFLIASEQLRESRHVGADAVLLIARILDAGKLNELAHEARELGLAVVVEVHDEGELGPALETPAPVIGINSRDLESFDVDLARAHRLRAAIPPDRIVLAESGIKSREDLLGLTINGFDAALIGETLVRAPDPGRELQRLLGDPA